MPLMIGGPEVAFCQSSLKSMSLYLPVLGRCFSSSFSSLITTPPVTVLVVVFCVPMPMSPPAWRALPPGRAAAQGPEAGWAPARRRETGLKGRKGRKVRSHHDLQAGFTSARGWYRKFGTTSVSCGKSGALGQQRSFVLSVGPVLGIGQRLPRLGDQRPFRGQFRVECQVFQLPCGRSFRRRWPRPGTRECRRRNRCTPAGRSPGSSDLRENTPRDKRPRSRCICSGCRLR